MVQIVSISTVRKIEKNEEEGGRQDIEKRIRGGFE